MLKYQKLNSDNQTMNDANFTLIFDNDNQNNNHSASGFNNCISDTSSWSSGIGDLNHSSHSSPSNIINTTANSTTTNSTMSSTMDTDESTIEVPLLSNNNNNDHEHHEYEQLQQLAAICRCAQPGFGANLKNNSTQEAKLRILLAVSLCCIFMVIEFLGGYIAGSLAIMTDAAHLASDCISFIIGLVAIWLGSKPPDKRMSFGYKRMEVMGAIVSILGIWILTATLIIVAIERIYSNDFDLDANTMMTISAVGILINIVMVFILHGSSLLPGGSHGHSHAHTHAHSHSPPTPALALTMQIEVQNSSAGGVKHKQNCDAAHEKNLNLRAAMIHVIGDLVQSIGVFLASVLIKIYPHAKFVDPMCTLIFSIIVIMTTVHLFKESVGILMDAVPLNFSLDSLAMDLETLEGVKSVHHLNVWNHTSNYCVLMVHLVIDLFTDSSLVLERATQLAHSTKYNIKHCTIQIERLPS